MIESITLAEVATYGSTPQSLTGLSQCNFFFGSNGAGKTTISRVIADELKHPTCKVSWKGGMKLESLIYNRDFVDRTFHQSVDLPGVFTLGENQSEILAKISETKNALDKLKDAMGRLTIDLEGEGGNGGKKGDLANLEEALKGKCWTQKQKHDAKLQGAFEGVRGSAERFKTRVLQELVSNKAAVRPLEYLEKKAESIFGPSPTREDSVPCIDTSKLITHETAPILKKRVIGKEDVDIAAMIKKLGNSDWVREGRDFHRVNDGACPFCQQKTSDAFAQSLNEYFDETFLTDSRAIDTLASNYATDADRLRQQLASIIASPSKFLDVEKLKAEKDLFDAKVSINNQRLSSKKKEASQVVELESLSNVFAAIKSLIDSASAQVAEHNRVVTNLRDERTALTAEVWRFVLEELKTDFTAYKQSKDALEKTIAGMSGRIDVSKDEIRKKNNEIKDLEKQVTSVQPTIDGINSLLASFGFQGFKLAKTASGSSYKLVRSDGSDAKATLSEGERTFVTFLYFYHLLKGSASDSGMTTNRVVAFDDPVSSLDSDILFIVSSLIKGLFDEVEKGTSQIKQTFVLTHNVYFHKEVSYRGNRVKDNAMKNETFWIVRKSGLLSKIEKYPTNPIKTSYELLWGEVRKPDRSNLSIQNTLRRILENYFKILGGIELDKLCEKFEGKEKIICKSLCSWVHDGSHNAHDNLYVSIDDSMVEAHLRVFREIFYKFNHEAHYKMMMGDAFVEESPPAPAVATSPSPAVSN